MTLLQIIAAWVFASCCLALLLMWAWRSSKPEPLDLDFEARRAMTDKLVAIAQRKQKELS